MEGGKAVNDLQQGKKFKQVRFSMELEERKISQTVQVPASANSQEIIELLEDWAMGQLLLTWENVSDRP